MDESKINNCVINDSSIIDKNVIYFHSNRNRTWNTKHQLIFNQIIIYIDIVQQKKLIRYTIYYY